MVGRVQTNSVACTNLLSWNREGLGTCLSLQVSSQGKQRPGEAAETLEQAKHHGHLHQPSCLGCGLPVWKRAPAAVGSWGPWGPLTGEKIAATHFALIRISSPYFLARWLAHFLLRPKVTARPFLPCSGSSCSGFGTSARKTARGRRARGGRGQGVHPLDATGGSAATALHRASV